MKYSEPKYFSKRRFIQTIDEATYAMVNDRKALRLIDKKARSNIMLAVTYVNGCQICSHFHAGILLKEGASDEELKHMLDGAFDNVPLKESRALFFAEHYADTDGQYDEEAFQNLKDYYGHDYARGVLASIKMIMFGNMNGIAIGNLGQRLRLKRPSNTKLSTDLFNGLAPIVLLPLFLVVNLLRK